MVMFDNLQPVWMGPRKSVREHYVCSATLLRTAICVLPAACARSNHYAYARTRALFITLYNAGIPQQIRDLSTREYIS